MRQNHDGTYGRTASDGFGNNDVPESDAGLLVSGDLKASVSLDAVTNLGEMLEAIDELPPVVHPSVPLEMLHPRLTQTAPLLKLWPLTVLVFYNVSGGPFGIESTIRAGGNFMTILGFMIFPLVWPVPEALITAELGAAGRLGRRGLRRSASVSVRILDLGFKRNRYVAGSFPAIQLRIAADDLDVECADNAIYPTLFMEYVSSVAGWDREEFSGWTRFASVAGIAVCLAMLNYAGLEVVGNASLVICVIAMYPFVILTILGTPKVVPSRWFQMPEPIEDGKEIFDDDFQTSPGLLPLVSVFGILWRPFDSAGSFAGETTSADTTYPRGVFIGLVMWVLGYIIPLLVAVGATDYSQADWVDGQLGQVAVDIGGKWLGMWTIFAAGISNLALFEAEMSSDAFKLMGMAERGYLPKVFQTRSKYGTPTAGIIFNTLVIVAFSCAGFGQLLEILNAVYAISLLLEYAAFVKLRLYHKEPVVFIVIPPSVGILVVLAISNWYVYFFCVGAVMFGITIFKLLGVCKQRGWFTYETKGIRNNQYSMSPIVDGDTANGIKEGTFT
ncbi:hypothetical protein ACHAWF_008779 [Thalassiosira exigua]